MGEVLPRVHLRPLQLCVDHVGVDLDEHKLGFGVEIPTGGFDDLRTCRAVHKTFRRQRRRLQTTIGPQRLNLGRRSDVEDVLDEVHAESLGARGGVSELADPGPNASRPLQLFS